MSNLTGCLNAWYISNSDTDSKVTVTAKGNITFGTSPKNPFERGADLIVNVGGKATFNNQQDEGAPLYVRTVWDGYTWQMAEESR